MSQKIISLYFLTLIVCIMLSACGVPDEPVNQAAQPVTNITAPAAGQQFSVDQDVVIKFGATDVEGIVQMEVTINGEPVYVETIDPPVHAFVAEYTWTPRKSGSYAIQAMAFSIDGDSSDPTQVVVNVSESGAAPVSTTAPTESESQTVATSTPPLLPTYTPTLTSGSTGGDQVNLTPMATALVTLNIRTGPGTAFPVVARLPQGQSAEILGRDEGGYWWQIPISAEGGDVGWIAAGGDFSTGVNIDTVPVIESSPSPASEPTKENSSMGQEQKPTIYSFTADRYNIYQGESVILRWDLANANTAHLRYGDVEEGVAAPGSKTVSPNSDTKYTIIARNDAGETTADITITVGGPAPTAVPILRDGKTHIVPGQSIDFDHGVVQDTIGTEVDFYWDGEKKQFTPQRGATGSLLSMGYGDINLETCLAASYGQPINANLSTLLTGCYKTSQGNYGKFYVADWDLAGNLTLEWLTWDYR